VRHHRVVPAEPTSEACPGCGAVLAPATRPASARPGASPSCLRLFEVTLRGLREESAADSTVAAVVRLADDTYAAQHPGDDAAPRAWRLTIADVAADLDVIDLSVLVESWARTVREDRAALSTRP
jgi:Family of unknown function (DUF5946)